MYQKYTTEETDYLKKYFVDVQIFNILKVEIFLLKYLLIRGHKNYNPFYGNFHPNNFHLVK